MQTNQMQKYNTRPRIPTPTTSMVMVKRSEIVMPPTKAVNNLESINNNQTSNRVNPHYLDVGKKIRIKSE
jgi:hypothetical protein